MRFRRLRMAMHTMLNLYALATFLTKWLICAYFSRSSCMAKTESSGRFSATISCTSVRVEGHDSYFAKTLHKTKTFQSTQQENPSCASIAFPRNVGGQHCHIPT